MKEKTRKAEGAGKSKLPRYVRSLEDFYSLIARNAITVGVLLGGCLRSTHSFELVNGTIFDYSLVDDSLTEYTKKEFEKTIYAQAIRRKAMVLEEVRP